MGFVENIPGISLLPCGKDFGKSLLVVMGWGGGQ